MANVISLGELAVGQRVTVLETKTVVDSMEMPDGQKIRIPRQTANLDMFKGVPMEIVAINLPYVIVKTASQPVIFDTRMVTFMEITPEYANALGSMKKMGATDSLDETSDIRKRLHDRGIK